MSAIEEFLNDNSKFSKLDILEGKEINLIVNLEERIISELKLLKGMEIINKSTYKSINQQVKSIKLTISAIATPTYKLAQFLLTFLTPSPANSFTVIDSFHFDQEVRRQDSNLHIASLNVDSLFPNIPLEERIEICVSNLYNDNDDQGNIAKHDFRNLLNVATEETFFMFNSKYYKQVDGVAKGSPLSPALANVFMCSF